MIWSLLKSSFTDRGLTLRRLLWQPLLQRQFVLRTSFRFWIMKKPSSFFYRRWITKQNICMYFKGLKFVHRDGKMAGFFLGTRNILGYDVNDDSTYTSLPSMRTIFVFLLSVVKTLLPDYSFPLRLTLLSCLKLWRLFTLIVFSYFQTIIVQKCGSSYSTVAYFRHHFSIYSWYIHLFSIMHLCNISKIVFHSVTEITVFKNLTNLKETWHFSGFFLWALYRNKRKIQCKRIARSN